MRHSKAAPTREIDQVEKMASDLSIAMWNRLAQLPQFGQLHPKDFPLVYEAVHDELRRAWRSAPAKGDH